MILVTTTDTTENFDWTTINFQPAEFTTYTTLTETLLELIRRCQTESFSKDIKRVKEGKELHRVSSLLHLRPLLDGWNTTSRR